MDKMVRVAYLEMIETRCQLTDRFGIKNATIKEKGETKIKKWMVRIWCMIASYTDGPFYGTKEEAIRQARAMAMKDMKHWNYTAYEADE
jgi:hypothetical protein